MGKLRIESRDRDSMVVQQSHCQLRGVRSRRETLIGQFISETILNVRIYYILCPVPVRQKWLLIVFG